MSNNRRGVCAAAFAFAAFAAVVCLPAAAQFDAAGQAVLMQQHQVHTGNVLSAEQGALHAGQRGGNAWGESLASLARRAPTAAAAPAAALRFRRDPSLSARLQREQVGVDVKGVSMTPAQMHDKFDALLVRYGYSRDNLGDVAATYLVMAWEVVNDRNAKDVPGGERAVRAQLQRAMLTSPALRGMDDAQKQAMAERLMYSAMRNGVSYQVYRQTRDRARLATLSERMRREVMTAGPGLDLRQFELSAKGLVKR